LNKNIENALQATLKNIWDEYSKTEGQNVVSNSQSRINKGKTSRTTQSIKPWNLFRDKLRIKN